MEVHPPGVVHSRSIPKFEIVIFEIGSTVSKVNVNFGGTATSKYILIVRI